VGGEVIPKGATPLDGNAVEMTNLGNGSKRHCKGFLRRKRRVLLFLQVAIVVTTFARLEGTWLHLCIRNVAHDVVNLFTVRNVHVDLALRKVRDGRSPIHDDLLVGLKNWALDLADPANLPGVVKYETIDIAGEAGHLLVNNRSDLSKGGASKFVKLHSDRIFVKGAVAHNPQRLVGEFYGCVFSHDPPPKIRRAIE